MAKAWLRPATKAESSRAYRLRRKSEKQGKLSRTERNWLRRYQRDRRLYSSGAGRPDPATSAERSRAYRLRKKRDAGKRLTLEESRWLKRYRKGKAVRRRSRKGRRPSTMVTAKRIRDAVRQWVYQGREWDDSEEWYREPRKGLRGIAIANAEWPDPSYPIVDEIGIVPLDETTLPPSNGDNANVKMRWAFVDDLGDVVRRQWVSMISLTPDFEDIPGDLIRAFDTSERPSLRVRDGEEYALIDAVSIYVSPPRVQ